MAKRHKKDPLEALMKPDLELKRSELDLFTPPNGQDAILSSQEVTFTPLSSLDNDGPVVFCIPAVDDFTDLTQTYLALEVKVQKSDNKSIQAEPDAATARENNSREVSVPNDFFDCLARRIVLQINSVSTGSDHNHHPQVAVLKNLMSYPEDVGEANLKHALVWMPDNGETYRDSMNLARFKHIAGSREITLISRLSHDVFNSCRLLPPGNTLKVRIDRSSPEFALIRHKTSTSKYQIKWTDARLSVMRVKVKEHVTRATEMHFKNGCPIYMPFARTDARSFEIPTGTRYYRAQSLFSGVLPQRAVLVLMDPDSLGNGSYTNNPTIFPAQKYGVSQVQFLIDERQVLPRAYRPDWDNKQYQYEYQGLLRVMKLDQSLTGSCMDYEAFGRDYGIFAVCLKGVDGKESGNVSVELRFDNATTEPISGLLIPEFRSCVMIDSNGNVHQSDY